MPGGAPSSSDGLPRTFFERGNAYHLRGEFEAAAACYLQALSRLPQDADAWNNLGKTWKELNRLDEAVAAYDHAIRRRPDFVVAHCNRAIALLAAGRFAEGLVEFEWRWRMMTSRGFTQPRWDGSSRPDDTLFIHAEQGMGDTLHFVRFVRLAREQVGRVILECQPPLRSLFEFNQCADAVIAVGEAPPPFDYYLPLLSLPLILGIPFAEVGTGVPYLTAPPIPEPAPWSGSGKKIGLAWAGNPHHKDNATRSLRLEDLVPVLAVPGVQFFSLQVGMPPADIEFLSRRPAITNLEPHLVDFSITAAWAAQMDLIIAPDSAVAHLCGALGRPTWTFVPDSPDWRWLLDRADTPWYPGMRLFRQTQRGAWADVVERMSTELARTHGTSPRD